MLLELGDRRRGDVRRRAAHGGRGVQRGGERERGDVVGEDPGDVGGQVHDVGQVQHERRLGHVHRRAVRRQRVGDRAHGVLVLLQVLGRAGERRGEREVVRVVAGTADRAGQHAGGDQPLLAAARAARASRRRGRRPRTPRCRRSARPAAAAATGGRSARPRRRRGRAPGRPCRARPRAIRATAAATAPDHCGAARARRRRRPPRPAPAAGCCGAGSTAGRQAGAPTPIVVSHHRPPRRPTTTSGTTSVAPAGRRRRRTTIDPNATGPVPGSPTSSRTTACATTSRHHRPGLGEPVLAARPRTSARAPADQPVAAAHPGHDVRGVGRGQERQQGPRVVERPRCGPPGARAARAGAGSGPGEDVTASKPTTGASASAPLRDRCRPGRAAASARMSP